VNRFLKTGLIIFAVFLSVLTIIIFINKRSFNNKIEQEIKQIISFDNSVSSEIITKISIEHLPEPLQKFLDYSGVIGTPKYQNIMVRQNGKIKLDTTQQFLDFTAVQYYNTVNPSFLWTCQVPVLPFVSIYGRDLLLNGNGNMWIRFAHLFTIANATGSDIDHASLIRYLSEMLWFPHALTNDFIRWEIIDANSARAIIKLNDIEASGVFYFDDSGRITLFRTIRFKEGDEQRPWKTTFNNYQRINGIMIPCTGQAIWELPEQDFVYIDIDITDWKQNINKNTIFN